MPKKQWTWFYKWIAKDDYVTTDATYLQWDNIDSSIFGYGATISRKSNKAIETHWPIFDINGRTSSLSEELTRLVWYNDTDWYIYTLASTDNVPEGTISSTDTEYWKLSSVIWLNSWFVLLWRTSANTRDFLFHYSNTSSINVSAMDFDVSFPNRIFNDNIPPMISAKWLGLIWSSWSVLVLTPWNPPTFSQKSIFTDEVKSIQESWTTILVYTEDKRVAVWDWVATSVNATKKIGHLQMRTVWTDKSIYWVTNTWNLLNGNGYSFNEEYKKRKTLKWESSSSYEKILDFSMWKEEKEVSNPIEAVWSDIYIIQDWNKIAQLWSVRPWVPQWMSTILNKNYNWVDIDKIYCLREINGRLYFSYKAGTYYWVDYIDFDALESNTQWTIITSVFRGVPDTESKIKRIKITYSNTSWNKGIDLYKRINGWSWVLIRNYNESSDAIKRSKITNQTDQFVDIQFKVVFTNTDQDDTPPILHDLSLEYSVIEE